MLTEALKTYAERKIERIGKMLRRKNEAVASVELGKTANHHTAGDIYRAEVNLRVGGTMYRAVSHKNNLYEAIDDVGDELEGEVASGKDKSLTLQKRIGSKFKMFLKKIR